MFCARADDLRKKSAIYVINGIERENMIGFECLNVFIKGMVKEKK